MGLSSKHSRVADVTTKSYKELEIDDFNNIIIKASIRDEIWVKDPLQVALRFVGPFEGRNQQITRNNDNAEMPKTVQITIVEDGYLDDSVRGSKYLLTLEIMKDKIWHVIRARKVWRCWPNRGHEGFSSSPCF